MVVGLIENDVTEDKYDFEDERLAVKGFVVDYFTYRLKLSGYEWYDRPPLPHENLLEYSAMRKVALIFEEKYEKELKEMVVQLSGSRYLTFQRYVEVVEEFFRIKDEFSNQLSYGHLISLISFGGLMVTELAKKNARSEIGFIAVYTSKFLEKRIKLTWAKDGKSWAEFFERSIAIISSESRSQSTFEKCLRLFGRLARLVSWPFSSFRV